MIITLTTHCRNNPADLEDVENLAVLLNLSNVQYILEPSREERKAGFTGSKIYFVGEEYPLRVNESFDVIVKKILGVDL